MKKLSEIKWVSVEGNWILEGSSLRFKGGEFSPKLEGIDSTDNSDHSSTGRKIIYSGIVLFNQPLKDGILRAKVSFDSVDERSCGAIILQYDTTNGDHISFGVTGGNREFSPENTGFMYKLRTYGNPLETQQSNTSMGRGKAWNEIFTAGLGYQIKEKVSYDLETESSSSVITMKVNGVEIGRSVIKSPYLPGLQCGLLAANNGDVIFEEIEVSIKKQKIFIAMQFDTPEYESLYNNVIMPVCVSEGFEPYRADSTFLPGLIIDDIKKQIQESYIVIAEISTNNPNVYYELGYADALGKPVVLISDKNTVIKPFDVRAYRTLFYENSINGKDKVESDLRKFLKSISNNK